MRCVLEKPIYLESGKHNLQHASGILQFGDTSLWTLLSPTWLTTVHVVLKFPQAEMEGSQTYTVSLLQQEIADLCLQIQQIKVNFNKLSCPKTKDWLEKYNLCVEQLDKVRKVHKSKVEEFEELQSELL